jgi:hypothetical protein
MMDYLNEGVNRREKNSVEPITWIIHVNYREPKTKAVLQRGRWPSGMLDMIQIKMKDYEFQRIQKLII